MIRKVHEVDPLLCPECGYQMKIIAFLTDYDLANRTIGHLKLGFIGESSPPQVAACVIRKGWFFSKNEAKGVTVAGLAAADRVVFKPESPHLVRVVDVPTIDNNRVGHEFLDQGEV